MTVKLLVRCFFRLHGRPGATIGMVARELRRVGLAEGSQRSARHGVRAVVEQWMKKPRGSHRAIERISAWRYRATLKGKRAKAGHMTASGRQGNTPIWIKTVAGIYGIQAFVAIPWFSGGIQRGEQSLWAWPAYQDALERHGQGDALLTLYLYAIFYSCLVVVPYVFLWVRDMFILSVLGPGEASDAMAKRQGLTRLVMAVWCGVSYVLFSESIREFIDHLPLDGRNEWLYVYC